MKNSDKDKPGIMNNKAGTSVDEQELEDVKDILRLLSKTVSTVKIFLPEHTTVQKMITDLWKKLDAFLEKHEKLQVRIREFSFSYEDKKVFEDQKAIKSLPFLFYKDGMENLYFHKGLKKEELQEFMVIIKKVYKLPPEESDIVNLLWEKDFANIRYFAPDDFLETKIGQGKKPVDIRVDKEHLFSGKVELLPEDKKDLEQNETNETLQKIGTQEEENEEHFIEQLGTNGQVGNLSERENRILEAMLTANRQISPEEELVLLLSEMLLLEADLERYKDILGSVSHLHRDLIQKGNFFNAHQLVSHVLELKMFLVYQSDPKEKLIDEFLKTIKSAEDQDLIKKTIEEGKVADFQLFFAYLNLLYGPDAAPILADIYDKIKNPEFRQRTLQFFKDTAQKNPKDLLRITKDDRPELTRQIISIISSIPERRAVQSLAVFLQFRNHTIKTEAIKTLGRFENLTSSKILLGFLSDEEKNLRIMAAQNIKFAKDDSIVEHIKNLVSEREFMSKDKKEKQAVLDILGRSKTKNAYKILEDILKKSKILARAKHTETRLCVVHTLETMGSPEARRILRKGLKVRKKKIRMACKLALTELPLDTTGQDD